MKDDPRALPRVTYSNINEDFSGVQDHFDGVIAGARASLLGREHANIVGGREVKAGEAYVAPCPIDRTAPLGAFFAAGQGEIAQAIAAARTAQRVWGRMKPAERADILLKAAGLVEERKFEIAAACLFEVGKSRMEALGEVEEAIDLIRYYANELVTHDAFARDLKRAQASEETHDVLRPYGVFAVIAPFNFPFALSAGMTSTALLAGNCVVFKPSPMAGLTGSLLAACYRDAGMPDGVFNLVCGGAETGRALVSALGVDGVAFTGSNAVGMEILRTFGASGPFARPVLAEMGGKNPAYVTASADLDRAVSGVSRSAFGLQGQKCSACSVVFVHDAVRDAFLERLTTATRALKIGDPTERDVFMGPVINEAAFRRFEKSVGQARSAGAHIVGGDTITGAFFDNGFYVEPTIVADLPDDHALHRDELFLPFLTVRSFSSLPEAIARGNAVRYGLTAGVYAQDEAELNLFLDTAEAGVLYANRPSGATTGAWPGFQTFSGWKGSGTGAKGGLGPWYLPQFMREQSRTIIR